MQKRRFYQSKLAYLSSTSDTGWFCKIVISFTNVVPSSISILLESPTNPRISNVKEKTEAPESATCQHPKLLFPMRNSANAYAASDDPFSSRRLKLKLKGRTSDDDPSESEIEIERENE